MHLCTTKVLLWLIPFLKYASLLGVSSEFLCFLFCSRFCWRASCFSTASIRLSRNEGMGVLWDSSAAEVFLRGGAVPKSLGINFSILFNFVRGSVGVITRLSGFREIGTRRKATSWASFRLGLGSAPYGYSLDRGTELHYSNAPWNCALCTNSVGYFFHSSMWLILSSKCAFLAVLFGYISMLHILFAALFIRLSRNWSMGSVPLCVSVLARRIWAFSNYFLSVNLLRLKSCS